MEPMALGSPHSPAPNMQAPAQANPQAGYLPNYLLGASPSLRNAASSSAGVNSNAAVEPLTPNLFRLPSTDSERFESLRSPFDMEHRKTSAQSTATPAAAGTPAGAGGPPTSSLMVSTPKFSTPTAMRLQQHSFSAQQSPVPSLDTTASRLDKSVLVDGGSDDAKRKWVTIFGFPPSATGYILSQFSQYGNIACHHMPANSNWMHVKYQTRVQAQKALSKSIRVLGGSIMIGVCPCTDANVEENVASVSALGRTETSFFESGGNVSNVNSTFGGNGARLNTSIRPLAQTLKSSSNQNQVLSQNDGPNKSSGIMGKAIEFIFGW